MPVDILVPPLSQTSDSLVLVSWLKMVGDTVIKGEPLFTVETDKATLEVEAPASGIMASILANPGDEMIVRSVIGSIKEPEEIINPVNSSRSVEGRFFTSPRARQIARQKGILLASLQGLGSGPHGAVIAGDVEAYHLKTNVQTQTTLSKATPVARRMAEAAGLNLDSIQPSKPGSITKADIKAAISDLTQDHSAKIESSVVNPPPNPDISLSSLEGLSISHPLTPTRRTISKRLVNGHLSGVAVTYMRDADATRLVKLRRRILKRLPEGYERPTITDFMVLLVCRGLADHPDINATFDGENVQSFDHVNLSLAVDTPRGLVAPVIHNADQLGLQELAKNRKILVERALNGTLTINELGGGTITLTNLGAHGVDFFTPVLNPPQLAILGIGKIREVPAIHKGKIRSRWHIGLALTCDHRVIDGAPAARFLETLSTLIEQPDLFWL